MGTSAIGHAITTTPKTIAVGCLLAVCFQAACIRGGFARRGVSTADGSGEGRLDGANPPVPDALGEALPFDRTGGDLQILTLKLPPAADASVKQGGPSANYGLEGSLTMGICGTQNLRTWLKFDLTAVPAAATIVDARISLFYYIHWTSQAYTAHTSADDSWTETGITWSGQPAYDSEPVDTCPPFEVDNVWRSFNVTGPAEQEHGGDGQLSVVLKGADLVPAMNPPDQENYARSREYAVAAEHPYLEVLYTLP